MNKRNAHPPEYKIKAVLEFLNKELTLTQVSQKSEDHGSALENQSSC